MLLHRWEMVMATKVYSLPDNLLNGGKVSPFPDFFKPLFSNCNFTFNISFKGGGGVGGHKTFIHLFGPHLVKINPILESTSSNKCIILLTARFPLVTTRRALNFL